MERFPLVDELAVIDSGSDDRTVKIAQDAGAKTFTPDDFLKVGGAHKGKGENLWQSLYLLHGDIISWVDADIKNIDPRFVYGPVGVLLNYSKVKYVKGCYERPYQVNGKYSLDGGRVTELDVRPLFNIFYPRLSKIQQPLSGEYAGRREILEQIPFPVGYFIETQHLLDICEMFGLDRIAQVDLVKRVHRNQSTVDLGKMAFAIQTEFLKYMEKRGDITIHVKMYDVYRKPMGGNKKRQFGEFRYDDIIRPPMITIPAYEHKFHGQPLEAAV